MTKHTVDTPYPVGPVNFYTFEDQNEIVMFDAGPPTSDALQYMASHIDFKRLSYVFITHSHSDHFGLANFITEKSNVNIIMARHDILKYEKFDARVSILKNTFFRYGFDKKAIDGMVAFLMYFKDIVIFPKRYTVLEEIDVKGVSWIKCPGHSTTDVVYIYKGYAITGDFLLNNVFQTPLLDVDFDRYDIFDNYGAYCESLLNLETISKFHVLPGHGYVRDIEKVVSFYVSKLFERTSLIKYCFKKNCSLAQTVSHIVDPYKEPFKTYIKASEIAFFRRFFYSPDEIKNNLKQIGIFSKNLSLQFDRAVS